MKVRLSLRLPAWLRHNATKRARVLARLEEGLHEIGVLLMAFAPLDVALLDTKQWGILALFLSVGFTFFCLAIIMEWRRDAN